MKCVSQTFDKLDGQEITEFTLQNDKGTTLKCLNYGCIITYLSVRDRFGNLENVVLGFDTIDEYLKNTSYFGGVIGRVAGRIKGGEFTLLGKEFSLTKNNGPHHLHGGDKGFNQKIWLAAPFENEKEAGVAFSYKSVDGEEGYPGTVHLVVTYTLTNEDEIILEYKGISDEDTLLNLTNHTYFNLSGNCKRDVLGHKLKLKSDTFLEATAECLPTGKLMNVTETPFDFRKGRYLSDGILSSFSQNQVVGHGYDHGFLLKENFSDEICLEEEGSGRRLFIETNQPCVVVYTGNYLSETEWIRSIPSRKHLGVCFETQGCPDAIHHDHLPSIVVPKGQLYHHKTKWRFETLGE